MNFTDGIFYFFLPLVLFLAFGISWKSDTAFKVIIIAASSFFYGYWDYRFLALLYTATIVDFLVGLKIEEARSQKTKKRFLWVSMTVNLGMLFFFKYCNFFLDNLRAAGVDLPHLNVILPIGISFYTFQTMSYTIDVYRGELKAEKKFLNYLYCIIFFPQLVAGPIVRAGEFLPQVQSRPKTSLRQIFDGTTIFVNGLIKKLLFADTIAPYVDHVFHSPEIYSTWTIWGAVLAYAIQIFCDFSGYTDMAIGIAHMFGHKLVMNFNLPYVSRSITEFWRRWHMSLSRWIRDYIYISMGGNRKGAFRTYVNLTVTMLLGGLWHGASWNFVIWGGLHGGALAFERFFNLDRKYLSGPIGILRWALTMLYILITWVFFRAKDLPTAGMILKKMFAFEIGIDWIQMQFSIVLIFFIAFHLLDYFWIKEKFVYFLPKLNKFLEIYLICVVLLGLVFLNPRYYNPFIYFQF
jgi:alginate O-acetyltransferase complex protein AlgI